MKAQKQMQAEKTAKGFPALWEEGGGYTNTGSAIIIAGSAGEPLRPFYIRRRGHLANGQHALLPIRRRRGVTTAGARIMCGCRRRRWQDEVA